MVGGSGFEPLNPEGADLQSAGFEPLAYPPVKPLNIPTVGHSFALGNWLRDLGSNQGHHD